MLEENMLSWTKGVKAKRGVIKSYEFTCPCCSSKWKIDTETIDDYLTSDTHNPSEDIFYCPSCESSWGLYKGLKLDDGSYLFCDGSNVFVSDTDEEVYILV